MRVKSNQKNNETEQKDFYTYWIDEIENPENKYYVKVQRKVISRDSFLEKIREDGIKKGVSEEEIERTVKIVQKDLWGFGIIDELINERDDVSDIRLTDENTIRIKTLGKREGTELKFKNENDYLRFIEHITTRNNTNTSLANAIQVFVDDVSSPVSILRFTLASELVNTSKKPTLLIRKILKNKKDFTRLIEEQYLTNEQYEYIKRRWESGHGILVCGPNGSGKTTLINAILDLTPKNKAAVVIQESAELFCDSHPEMIFRTIVPKRNNSSITYSISDLGRIALMESFDIIVVGEVKGAEAAEIAYATYTGSQCMTSVHSISAKDGYKKMIDYAMESEGAFEPKHYANQFQALDTVIYVKDYHVAQIEESKFDESDPNFFSFNTIYSETENINHL